MYEGYYLGLVGCFVWFNSLV